MITTTCCLCGLRFEDTKSWDGGIVTLMDWGFDSGNNAHRYCADAEMRRQNEDREKKLRRWRPINYHIDNA